MSDDKPDNPQFGYRTAEEAAESRDKRLESGEPLFTFYFDQPIDISVGTAGDMAISCPCLASPPGQTAGVVRISLTAAATHTLLQALEEVRKIQDELGGVPPTRSTH